MTDNFQNYKDFINIMGGLPNTKADSDLDKYYVIELLKRGKDNPNTPAANYHFKNYYIYSWKDFDDYEQEIKDLCNLLRLRAYCSVNYKLMSQVALNTLAESARRIAAHDCKKFYKIFESESGRFVDKANNIWIVDIDEIPTKDNIDRLFKFINTCESDYDNNVIYTMPTKSGIHLLTHAFNLKKFNTEFPYIVGNCFKEIPEIKKNHLTLLYENL